MNQLGTHMASVTDITLAKPAEPSNEWWDNPYAKWLLTDGWECSDPVDLVHRFAHVLRDDGVPLLRLRVTIRILHPLVVGTTYTWDQDTDAVEVHEPSHDVLESKQYLNSPYAAIFEGAGGIRRRLDIRNPKLEYPILVELKERGATDYVAMPFLFRDRQVNVITVAAYRPGGFSSAELTRLYGMLPALGRVYEVHAHQRTSRSLLDTYLGAHSGKQVLDGLVKRGDGEDIYAVIWFCDLRDSTPLADSMARHEFLAVLNDFFDCMAGAVLDNGGEVLRFIGDAVLAIFPIRNVVEAPNMVRQVPERCPMHRKVCETAVRAARDARRRVHRLNTERTSRGHVTLRFGVALHLGEVTYGNIGTPQRLEFTVVGSDANEAARLEGQCKRLNQTILASVDFAKVLPDEWVSLGYHQLRGLEAPRELFALRDGIVD